MSKVNLSENRLVRFEKRRFSDENWPAMIEWPCRHTVKLEEAFSEPLGRLNPRLRSQGANFRG